MNERPHQGLALVTGAASSHHSRYLRFRLAEEDFAIPLLSIREVVAMPETTRVPHTPAHFLGIMNLRGQIISIFDLRSKLGFKSERSSETAVVICDFEPLRFGVVVDSVEAVMTLDDADIAPRPDVETRVNSEYIQGVAKRDQRLVLLLDLPKALSLEDLIAMKKVAAAS
ncbi:MAG: chemotaxis protein CheW [Proteobacteria bacterium]|nr:chemotaxis protein CheW [Pseudomonadota bacterium]